jgi:aminoglycoside/choline kinase family phosphotransferase
LSDRSATVDRFLAARGWSRAHLTQLAGDASFRTYARLSDNGRRAILMDAPPPVEDVRPFVRIGRHLSQLGLSAPTILAADEDRGLLLIEDFGDDTFTRLLASGADERSLYTLAVDVLLYLHRLPGTIALPDDLPAYDLRRLVDEALLFVDWYLRSATGAPLSETVRQSYSEAWSEVLTPVAASPKVLVLRDFHVDNLMGLPQRPGVAACGLLDFQDAVAGPAAYDLMSLLEDARRDLSPGLREALLDVYLAAGPIDDRGAFLQAFHVLAAQRHAKVIGIFTRLWLRDGKRTYLAHIPRVWRLLEEALAKPALRPVSRWFDSHVPDPIRQHRPAASA